MSYSWIPFYREVAARVLTFENKQDELLELLRERKAAGFLTVPLQDNQPGGTRKPLKTIDPFTFMANFGRLEGLGDFETCAWIKQNWNLEAPVPTDFDGRVAVSPIPRGSWFFDSLENNRDAQDIPRLWQIARQAYDLGADGVDPDLFARCIKQGNMGIKKLTEGLAWFNPDEFLPLSSIVLDYIKTQDIKYHRASLHRGDLQEYRALIQKVENLTPNIIEFVEAANNPRSDPDPKPKNLVEKPTFPLNQILYGPPGTGKTFGTIERAVEIIDGVKLPHKEAKARFDQLRADGQIEFVTFHQSFSYEEFIEGLRPILDDESGQARYEVRAGVLKELALRAIYVALSYTGGFEECWEHFTQKIQQEQTDPIGHLADSQYEVTSDGKSIEGKRQSDGENVSLSKTTVRRLWKGTSTTQFIDKEDVHGYFGEDFPSTDFAVAIINEMSLEIFDRPKSCGQKLLDGDKSFKADFTNPTRYVLVVDEINRGNISKILGELITLLEDDKRLGADNELSVTLPISLDKFALPPNLYILGTMNTADKSLALLDIALRRRFEFEEIRPDFALCQNLSAEFVTVLQTLNLRLEAALDREHCIGHAYFMRVENAEQFNAVFRTKIIPLLQEFFYNDWETLRAVLGESNGKTGFIRPLPALAGLSNRTHWRWWFDENPGESLDCFQALSRNYAALQSP